MSKITNMGNDIVFDCPHCNGTIIVDKKEIACKIFRHAVYKETNQPIEPHASKQHCDNLLNNDLIRGCAGPIEIINDTANKCDYK